jgi:putative protease
MDQAVRFAHQRGVRVYVACNVYPRTREAERISSYLEALGGIGPDAVIIADPGIFRMARRIIPEIPIHISTQANTTSLDAVRFWQDLSARRVNMARELSLDEIREIASGCDLEIEAFVHGAMCISYSGRCLLSSFMTGRDSNQGRCSHPCRFRYTLMEAKRPGEHYPILEDDRGSYIFNSRDLCMIGHIPAMIDAGIHSFKIEGRMKGINYLASVVKVYREAIDACMAAKGKPYSVRPDWREALAGVNHRGYCTGFYLGDPGQTVPSYVGPEGGIRQDFAGKVLQRLSATDILLDVRNKITAGAAVRVLSAAGPPRPDVIRRIAAEDGGDAPHAKPGSRPIITLDHGAHPLDLIHLAPAGR